MGLLSIVLGLLGCDARKIEGLEEGISTETDVRARFGEPDKVWSGDDLATLPLPAALFAVVTAPGARTFEYNRQPSGNVNYMITIGPDGKLSALRQVLSPPNFARVLPGMTLEQVRKMLGKPMKVTPFALQQSIHHDWRYLSPPSTARIFTVVFDSDLRVVSTGSADEEGVSPTGR
jgi:SmpA / OmlA family